MGVGIDEARAHDEAVGVDRVGGIGVDRVGGIGVGEVAGVGHGHNPAVADADVGWAGRPRPVPSISVPPVISVSNMALGVPLGGSCRAWRRG